MRFKKSKEYSAYDKIMKKYGASLYKMRVSKKLTIEQAAKEIEITPYKLGKIEQGTYDFSIEILYKLGFLYDFEPRDFVNLYSKNTATKNKKK